MEATLASITTGMPENEISARLIYEGQRRGCLVPVSLIAADDRILRYRHPLPTRPGAANEKRVGRCVMVVAGMVATAVGIRNAIPPGTEYRFDTLTLTREYAPWTPACRSHLAPVKRSAAYSRPASRPTPALASLQTRHNHHQGGSTGYAARTCKGAPGETFLPRRRLGRRPARGPRRISQQSGRLNPSAPGEN